MIYGEYRVYQNGRMVACEPNLITTFGRSLITRYLAGQVSSFAGAIAIGTGSTAATVNDSKLEFELSRSEILLKTPEVSTGRIVFSTSINDGVSGQVYELGVYPYLINRDVVSAGNILFRFDSFESWTGGSFNLTKGRTGTSSYSVTTAANTVKTISITDRFFNLGDYATSDVFSLSYFINDAFTNTISIDFHVDADNYYRYIVDPSATPGFYVTSWTKGSFVSFGSPSWSNVNYANISVAATSQGSTTVQLDALRIDSSATYPDYGLVSRRVLDSPISKFSSSPLDIEYVMTYA